MAGIYIHIPFCKQACHYCDFHFSTNLDLRQKMVECIVKELAMQVDYLKGEEVETIYFGGGTPSLLDERELSAILRKISEVYKVVKLPEITIEANPDDLSAEKLRSLFQAGFNRLSIGIQSFQDEILQFFNRAHNANDALSCIQESRNAGFDNISVDLIYGVPGQSDQALIDNIKQVVRARPEHISAYSLTIEPQTVFGKWVKSGKLAAPAEDLSASQLEIMVRELSRAGYQQYEVSNFAKPGFESQHNSSYWKRKRYLGVGPSAHSYNGSSRQYNVRNNHIYMRALDAGSIPFELEHLTREDQINEYLLTTLRTSWGADLSVLQREYNYSLVEDQHQYIESLIANGLADVQNQTLRLSPRGKMMADKISSDLFLIS